MKYLALRFLPFKQAFAVLFAAAVFSLFLLPVQTSAFDAGIGAGVFVPNSDMSKAYDPGYDIYAYVSFNMLPTLLDFRIQADWYNAAGKYTPFGFASKMDYKFRAVGGEALVILAPTMVPVIKPYLGVGWGLYNSTIEVAGYSETELGNGLVAVAGIGIEVVVLRIGLDGKYFVNKIKGDDYGGFGLGLSAAIVF